MTAYKTILELAAKKIMSKRAKAIERWITTCMGIIGVDASELKSLNPCDFEGYMAVRGFDIRYYYQGIGLYSDTEIHQIFNLKCDHYWCDNGHEFREAVDFASDVPEVNPILTGRKCPSCNGTGRTYKQTGPTLKIKHVLNDSKITLIISQELPPEAGT